LGAAAHLKATVALWISILVPPAAWAADETFSYALVKWSCGHQATLVLHVMTLMTMTTIAAAAVIGWSTEPRRERELFMRTLGLLMSALFFLATVALAVPMWLIDVCQ
jgi:hypothetical protein